MPLKPWHTVATPSEYLPEGKPLDASEFAGDLEDVRNAYPPRDYDQHRRKREPQLPLLEAIQQAEGGNSNSGHSKTERIGNAVLGRIPQSTILFAAGRSEALKRFLVEDAAGNDTRFWTLAQAISALYPSCTEEERWIDGLLARKKGLGFDVNGPTSPYQFLPEIKFAKWSRGSASSIVWRWKGEVFGAAET